MYIHGSDPFTLLGILITVISTWIITFRMRRKIRKVLGRKATEQDLTSIDTWMAVDEAEERNEETKPLNPK